MHTVNLKLCPKSLDFYFKVLLKCLAATWITKKQTRRARNTGFGSMTGAGAILGRAKGPSHACECCYMCVCSQGGKGFLRVSACHFIPCTAKPEQMLLLFAWYVGNQGFMHGTQHGHLHSSRCFLSSLLNSSVHHNCAVKWNLVVKSIWRRSSFLLVIFELSGCGRSLVND